MRAMMTARMQPPMVIWMVTTAPRRRPGRNSRKPAKVATARPTVKLTMTAITSGRKFIVLQPPRRMWGPAGTRQGVVALLGGAELRRRLGRQEVLAEAVRRYQREVLLAADKVLQHCVEGLLQVRVLLAETDRAV